MSVESILSITASLIAIGGLVYAGYQRCKKKSLSTLMTELVAKNTSVKGQQAILQKISRNLYLSGKGLSIGYIRNFSVSGRSKEVIFQDICLKNNIEPTVELCKRMLTYDVPSFRAKWNEQHIENINKPAQSMTQLLVEQPITNGKRQIVYLSALFQEKYPETYKRLTDILDKHNVGYALLKATRDIWCRDYMPVQTASGKLVQFKYDPSYLKNNEKYEASRSDVCEVCKANGIKPTFSDINLDGGNVLICGNRAIISDRVFSENPDIKEEDLKAELSHLLEAEIIIIPAQKDDFTGHADGMVRFVNCDTILGNDRAEEFKYWREKMDKVLSTYHLQYIDVPFFYGYKDKAHPEHAIGIYVNYLEVDNLIVVPVFGVPGNKDAEAVAKIKEIFPDKIVETIDYNEIALEGGVLNCTTWTLNSLQS